MKAKFKITNPDEAECTLTITMTLGAWKRLKEHLGSKSLGWELGIAITQLVSKAEFEFETDGEFQE